MTRWTWLALIAIAPLLLAATCKISEPVPTPTGGAGGTGGAGTIGGSSTGGTIDECRG